ncbi:MAG: DUF2852 domain-containing protein [Pseudomonadota bacterium]
MTKAPPRAHNFSILLFGIFALPVSIVAIVNSTFLGMVLTAFLGIVWLRLSGIQTGTPVDEALDKLGPRAEARKEVHSSGNASFDAYRRELLERLEQEQVAFDGFLERLRAAKDKTEFDDFMDARAKIARDISD